jgi:hypothetical protein
MWTEVVSFQVLFNYPQWQRGFRVSVPEKVKRDGLARQGDAMLGGVGRVADLKFVITSLLS